MIHATSVGDNGGKRKPRNGSFVVVHVGDEAPKLLEMPVRVDKATDVTTIVISRPEVRNAVDRSTALALREAFADFEMDDEQLVAVLWGDGGTFCSGYDLREAAGGRIEYDPAGEGPMGPTRLVIDKPVVAAIEGHAVAGGLELALWCDLRVVAADAVLGVFNRRWGVPLVDGGTVRLPRLIGQGRALDMILTGRDVGAEEALSWGLVDRVVSPGTARDAAENLAQQIARFPQAALRADRYSALKQWGRDIAGALSAEGAGGVAPLGEITNHIRPFLRRPDDDPAGD